MNIGICDDDKYIVKEIYDEVDKYFQNKEEKIHIDIFYSGEALLDKNKEYDLIFLDIEMPGKNGMEVAGIIYEKIKIKEMKNVKIVFLTSHDEVVRSAFRVNAFRFLIKDSYKNEIKECLDTFWDEFNDDKKYEIIIDGQSIEIKQKDIMYITSEHNGVEIWTKNRVCKHSEPLKKWVEELDKRKFIRAHKNSIVNIEYIDYIADEIILYSGEKVKYSKRNKKELKQMFEQYIYEKAW